MDVVIQSGSLVFFGHKKTPMSAINLTQLKTVLVKMGWDKEGNKHPQFLEQWQNATKKTQKTIDAHFEAHQDAGIAIVTGKESNITVIDFDSKDNPLFTQLFQECPTYWVATKKGFHLYYQYEPSLKQGTNRFGQGVDVRNDGGVVFCPPTKNYEGSDDEIVSLNKEALAILEAAYTPGKGAPSDTALKTTETRNDSLFRKACGWINEYEPQEVWNRMVKANKSFTKGELSDEELDILYKQVIQYKKDATEENPIEDLDLLYTESRGHKSYNVNTENIYRILDRHPEFKGKFRHDEWTQKTEILKGDGWSEIEDGDIVPIQRRISMLYAPFRGVKKDMVTDAIFDIARKYKFDSALGWLKGLTWDGKVRLEGWLSEVYGVENDSYHNAVGSNWMKGLAKRIAEPGCQFDAVLILKGKQGCGKSSSLTMLGRSWYMETTMRADSKDFFLQLRGKAIVEFAEGETLSKTETKQMKAVISARFDTYRPPYGRLTRDYPRRCVFAMTTNQDRPLKDETGNRRFFPVEVLAEKVNFKWLEENREQLFAEAYHRAVTLGETTYEYPDNVAAIQEASVEESPYEDDVRDWLRKGCQGAVDIDVEGATISDVWVYANHGDRSRITRRIQMELANALRACGFKRDRRMVDGERSWRWFPKDTIKPWSSHEVNIEKESNLVGQW